MGKATIFKRIITNTKKNIVRNKWLSISTILVVYLTFIIATSIVALAILSSKTVGAFERKAQIIVFFDTGTAEEDILDIQETLEDTGLVENVEYVSQEEALEIYKQDFEDDPTLVDSITADALPPSIELRVQRISDMQDVLDYVNNLKDETESIEDVMYFQDVIDTLEDISRIINTGGITAVVILSFISFVLILIAISFNINSHKHEINTMQLIGSSKNYVRVPFLLEGTFYGFLGSALSITSILVVWYVIIAFIRNGDMFYFISQTFNEIGTPYLKDLDIIFIIKVVLVEVSAGTLIGFLSSSIATWKHIK
jgi:cell division transport system permease protein